MKIYNSISSIFLENNMNFYEHTIIARQDISPSQIKQLQEKYTKIIENKPVVERPDVFEQILLKTKEIVAYVQEFRKRK